MSLLARYRRFWILIVIGLLTLPMIVQVRNTRATVSESEARPLSTLPALPGTWREWRALPRALDRFFADHFGLRAELVRAHAMLRYAVVLPTDLRVIYGRDNWLFLNDDGTIDQATGRLLRTAGIAGFADRAAQLQHRLSERNIRFIVAIPPNSATIMRARLPAWAAERPAVSEYDLMMAALAARGVPAVDLRQPLAAANSNHPVYRRTDTHWNRLGALTAYNAVAKALGKADWVIDPALVFRGFETVPGGDLARLLAVAGDITDEEAAIDLSPYSPPAAPATSAIDTQFESGGKLTVTGRSGPTVLVLGDSFTQDFWQDYFSLHASRYVWMHHEHCRFAQRVVEGQDPHIVILAPTERLMFCH